MPDMHARYTRRARAWLIVLAVGVAVSGLTAFGVRWEVHTLAGWMGLSATDTPAGHTRLAAWVLTVRDGLDATYARYPWVAYGTDWLAFAHLVLAAMFAGSAARPRESLWVIDCGLLACGGVVVLAMICGPIRGIPFAWRLIDCGFGLVAFVPLWLARANVKALRRLDADGGRAGTAKKERSLT